MHADDTSMTKRYTTSSIENLPNELFFAIFTYLTAMDLFYSFSNLNSRLSALIQSSFIQLRLRNDHVNLLSMINENQIKSLYFNEYVDLNLMMKYFENNHLIQLERLDFVFIELQSINRFVQFISTLKNLQSLSIKGRHVNKCEALQNLICTLTELPFTSPLSNQLLYFEMLISDLTPYYGYVFQSNPLSILKYFSIHSICLDDLSIILSWMPRIEFLKITYAFIVNDDEQIQLHEHDLTTRALMKMSTNSSLQRLEIGICYGVTSTHMEFLLAKLTNLRRLNCLFWDEYGFVFEQWIRIFRRSQIDSLILTIIILENSIYEDLSNALQADIWSHQIFKKTIFTEVSKGIRLEAHGINSSRANELDDQSLNEQPRKRQRTDDC